LLQEDVHVVEATVLRENLCRLDDLPLVLRVPSLPALNPGAAVELEISAVDLLELTFHSEFRREVDRFRLQPNADATVPLATMAER
jgi:exoribonuclease-2